MDVTWSSINKKCEPRVIPDFIRNWEAVYNALETYEPEDKKENFVSLKDLELDGSRGEAYAIRAICELLEIQPDKIKKQEDNEVLYDISQILNHRNYDTLMSEMQRKWRSNSDYQRSGNSSS